jgi:hypothetical protein
VTCDSEIIIIVIIIIIIPPRVLSATDVVSKTMNTNLELLNFKRVFFSNFQRAGVLATVFNNNSGRCL